jgi:hypothetical protein
MTWAAVGVIVAAIAGQALWVAHALGEVGKRLGRIDTRLDRTESTVLREHGERITRLEERVRA